LALLGGEPGCAAGCDGGVEAGIAIAAMVGDPPADGADVDAEEASDLGLGIALGDAGDGEASSVLELLSRS
jgi:hypothetical protein